MPLGTCSWQSLAYRSDRQQPRRCGLKCKVFDCPGSLWPDAAPPPGPRAAWKSTECTMCCRGHCEG